MEKTAFTCYPGAGAGVMNKNIIERGVLHAQRSKLLAKRCGHLKQVGLSFLDPLEVNTR